MPDALTGYFEYGVLGVTIVALIIALGIVWSAYQKSLAEKEAVRDNHIANLVESTRTHESSASVMKEMGNVMEKQSDKLDRVMEKLNQMELAAAKAGGS